MNNSLTEIDGTLEKIDSLTDPCGDSGFAEMLNPYGSTEPIDEGVTSVSTAIPLPEQHVLPEYPIESLGPILGPAADRLAHFVQVPRGMAGQSVLAAAALATQGHINVKRGEIETGPVSLFCLTIANSGDRKSALDELALRPIREFERARGSQLDQQLAEYQAATEAWNLRYKSIVKAASPKGHSTALSSSDENKLKKELATHKAKRPKPPTNTNITFDEPTSEGIWRHFQEGMPSAGLFSDEGIGFFSGHGMTAEAKGRTIAILSYLWGGKTLVRTRAAMGESGILPGRRLSAHLMIQPVVANEIFSDELLVAQGFLPRFLVCKERSLAGSRFLKNRDPLESPTRDPAIGSYWRRIRFLVEKPLNRKLEDGSLAPKTMHIEGSTFITWIHWHDKFESRLKSGGLYTDIQAFASKAAENLARVAAIMAYVEDSYIEIDHINRAGTLIEYYLDSMTANTLNAQYDVDSVRAGELFEWIKNNGGSLQAIDFKRLPSALRKSKYARKLLQMLVNMGHLQIIQTGKGGCPCEWRAYF